MLKIHGYMGKTSVQIKIINGGKSSRVAATTVDAATQLQTFIQSQYQPKVLDHITMSQKVEVTVIVPGDDHGHDHIKIAGKVFKAYFDLKNGKTD